MLESANGWRRWALIDRSLRRSVQNLQDSGVLLVEDGNHGEYRPQPEEFVNEGQAFIRAADMDMGQVLFSTCSRINEVARARIRKGIGAPNDILLSHKGTVGRLARVSDSCEPFVCSPQTTFWRVLDEGVIARDFLFYFMSSVDFQNQLSRVQGETDMAPYVSLTAQRRLEIPVPPLTVQKTATAVLRVIDDKVALNRRTAETLENIARTLFQSWFVNFDPVRRAAAGEDNGLSGQVAALFPSRLVDDELPEGWTLTPLPKMATFLNGLALQRFPPTDDAPSLPVIKIAEMRSGPKATSARATSALPSVDYIVEDGDHLFSWSGSLTHCIWSHGRGALNQHLFKVIPTSAPAWLCYFAVDHFMPEFQRIAAAKAVTMGHIQRHHLDEATLAIPPESLQKEIGKVMQPTFDRLKTLSHESRTLATLRDTLLPKLISGELRVQNVEKIVKSV